MRALSVAGLPWQLKLTCRRRTSRHACCGRAATTRSPRLSVFVLLVGLASVMPWLEASFAKRRQDNFSPILSPPCRTKFRSRFDHAPPTHRIAGPWTYPGRDPAATYFGVLQQETSLLHQLVEDILDFGCIDAGRRQYTFELDRFSRLVQEGIEEYRD